MKVSDIEAKHISGVGHVFTRNEFPNYIELPCLEACLHLYDLNIKTTSTNCNKENPDVILTFEFDSLSDENKEIARKLAKEGLIELKENDCLIKFNATLDDDVENISNKLLTIVSQFQLQDVISSGLNGRGFKIPKITFLNLVKNEEESLCIGFKFEFDEDGEIALNYYGNSESFSDEELREIEKAADRCFEKYDEMAKNNMIDSETGDVFANAELARKHQEYLEKTKGKKM